MQFLSLNPWDDIIDSERKDYIWLIKGQGRAKMMHVVWKEELPNHFLLSTSEFDSWGVCLYSEGRVWNWEMA